jgi:AraC-like DNA-binding protein
LRRARIVAAVAAALEAAERARLDTGRTHSAWPRLPEDLAAARDERALLDAGMRVLGLVGGPKAAPGRPAGQAVHPRTTYGELNTILLERLADGIELREAAENLGEKPPTISKRLRRKFGMSYEEYLSRLRVDRAKELLRRTRLSAADVARRVGIRDQSNFSKLFRKFEGLSPTEYRERFGRKR